MQRAGRRRTLQLTAPLWVASWLILGFAKYFPLVLVGRMLSGVCVGFVLATAQVYVSNSGHSLFHPCHSPEGMRSQV